MYRSTPMMALLRAAILFTYTSIAVPPAICKSVPTSSNWPDESTWSSFNKTLAGRLLAPNPPAIVCDASPTNGLYNKQDCKALTAKFLLGAFHTGDPVSVHWPNFQNDGCLPAALHPVNNTCDSEWFPDYVVNATTPQHVVETLNFAREKNIRLSVKNTGHDYLGRSTNPGLSLWTHHLSGSEFHDHFVPEGARSGCTQSVPAVTVMSGTRFGELYALTAKRNVVVVGGAEPDVGLGGYLTGGGHSPTSAKHGLCVDNVLEMVVVTPKGEIITANDYQNQDLFWAMKGGGGSTFGVLISATMKTQPMFNAQVFIMNFTSTKTESKQNNNENFFSAVAHVLSTLPTFSDNYGSGYLGFGPANLLGFGPSPIVEPPDPTEPLQNGTLQAFTWGGYMLDQPRKVMDDYLTPLMQYLNTTKGIKTSLQTIPDVKWSGILGTDMNATPAGYNSLLTSRLWDKATLENTTALIPAIRKLQYWPTQGLLVSGPAVRDPCKIRQTSVTPAWRRAYLHIIGAQSWDFKNETQHAAARKLLSENQGPVLRGLGPDMGAYINEADILEPDRQQAFWGAENYKRLLKIKKAYDPDDVLWCSVCVGSEDWRLDEDTGETCKRL